MRIDAHLDVTDNILPALLIAVICGLLGGLISDLVVTRRNGQTGMFELPGGKLGRLRDLGFLAPAIVGVIAAPVFLLAYQPTKETTVKDAVSTTTEHYSTIGLIAVSLLVGVASIGVISAMSKSVIKAAEAAKFDSILTGLKALKEEVEAKKVGIEGQGEPGTADQLVGRVESLIAQAQGGRDEAS